MISLKLARRLRDAGLEWDPANGDRFVVPDRDLDEHVFAVSDMTVDVHRVPGGQVLAFNGTVEWALDAIQQQEVVWLPSEAQLRERLGEHFRCLARAGERFRCELDVGGQTVAFEHADAVEVYGLALLHRLRPDGTG